jgi:hypothetical protein
LTTQMSMVLYEANVVPFRGPAASAGAVIVKAPKAMRAQSPFVFLIMFVVFRVSGAAMSKNTPSRAAHAARAVLTTPRARLQAN